MVDMCESCSERARTGTRLGQLTKNTNSPAVGHSPSDRAGGPCASFESFVQFGRAFSVATRWKQQVSLQREECDTVWRIWFVGLECYERVWACVCSSFKQCPSIIADVALGRR
jgi:hypothetical protein